MSVIAFARRWAKNVQLFKRIFASLLGLACIGAAGLSAIAFGYAVVAGRDSASLDERGTGALITALALLGVEVTVIGTLRLAFANIVADGIAHMLAIFTVFAVVGVFMWESVGFALGAIGGGEFTNLPFLVFKSALTYTPLVLACASFVVLERSHQAKARKRSKN